MREMVGGCCVCSDDRGWSENPLVYCDGQSCTVAVHQACYGIVIVPTGPWYCRKCESQERSVKVKCELCPSKYGALKRTDNSGWAHVVCALYIPEVRFENVTTMEPIQLQLIPTERFNKVCYICQEKGKASSAAIGACMQCNKPGCRMQFHVTCAQSLGLLCEEAGNYLDNVKYCGYCQHHYSKLRKGGNVKPIPPYKPVSSENHLSDSNSEKEAEAAAASASGAIAKQPSAPPAPAKRKAGSGGKGAPRPSAASAKAPPPTGQPPGRTSAERGKAPPPVGVGGTPARSAIKSGVIDESSAGVEAVAGESKVELGFGGKLEGGGEAAKSDLGGGKAGKKRKSHSRTPTPIGLVGESVIIAPVGVLTESSTVVVEKKVEVGSEKVKKPKIETTQSILINQPIVALTSISTIKPISALTPAPHLAPSPSPITQPAPSPSLPPPSIIQTASLSHPNSLVVSVPLTSTALSPHPQILSNQTSVLQSNPTPIDKPPPPPKHAPMTGGSSSNPPQTIISSEMSGGGLKIAYEKQDAITTEVDMELEVLPVTSHEAIAKRHEKGGGGRGKKRAAAPNGAVGAMGASTSLKRAVRVAGAPTPPQVGAFSSIAQIKDSPPSSPSSESQGASRGRTKARKSAPAAISRAASPKDSKDVKLFQNGVTAPHMLGNQLNPASNMAQKMSDHLNSELEAHSIFNPSDSSSLVGPQLHHRARASSTGGSSTASGGSGLSSMLSGNGGNIPQTLDQLLERQWEQGSQFLMEQAQHFDIASLLSCLHQLRAENLRLEEHVGSLLQRRDHLLAVNARLAIPLTGQPATPQSSHPHTVNNIHPAVGGASHGDVPRSARHNAHPAASQHIGPGGVAENGIPNDPGMYQHRGAINQSAPSPSIRHSPAGSAAAYSSSNLLRQNADTSGRSAPRPQPYPLYQGQGPSSQQQMVIRRDTDIHHPSSSKPS